MSTSTDAPPTSDVRRQWGADPGTTPLPRSRARSATGSSRSAGSPSASPSSPGSSYIVSAVVVRLVNREFRGQSALAGETLVYVAITSSLAFSCLMYLVARQGALYRTRAHRRVPRAVIDESFDADLPSMTVLVPSYREEVATVRMTLLSALLQEYPAMRVVLLLDDPPHPDAPEHVASLAATRAAGGASSPPGSRSRASGSRASCEEFDDGERPGRWTRTSCDALADRVRLGGGLAAAPGGRGGRDRPRRPVLRRADPRRARRRLRRRRARRSPRRSTRAATCRRTGSGSSTAGSPGPSRAR